MSLEGTSSSLCRESTAGSICTYVRTDAGSCDGRSSVAVPLETWWLPRPPRSRYPGGFPLHFEQRIYETLGRPRTLLQPFGGRAELGFRCDLNADLSPDQICDAHELPFGDDTFEAVLLDPPYSDDESRDLYGTPKLRRSVYTREAVRVARRHVVTYHVRLQPRPRGTYLERVIVVLLRSGHTARIVQIYRKANVPEYATDTLLGGLA
jgi:hypothetical protein